MFWLCLGALSTGFAEVIAGSSMFPFFNPWGIVAVTPLYTFHMLVLAAIVFRFGTPRLSTLFPAGMLFGLYEAYITKVLWDPEWGYEPQMLGGIAIVETMLLVLFWHSVLAFILPLVVGERVTTGPREIEPNLPPRLRRLLTPRSFLIAAAVAGLFQGVNSPSPLHSIASGLGSGAVVLLLCYGWRRWTRGSSYTIRELLPSGNEFWVCVACLALVYVLLGSVIRPDDLPGIGPQATIWVAYAVAGTLLWDGLRRSRLRGPRQQVQPPRPISRRVVLAAPVVFSTASAASLYLYAVVPPAFFVFWIAALVAGVALLAATIREAFARVETASATEA